MFLGKIVVGIHGSAIELLFTTTISAPPIMAALVEYILRFMFIFVYNSFIKC